MKGLCQRMKNSLEAPRWDKTTAGQDVRQGGVTAFKDKVAQGLLRKAQGVWRRAQRAVIGWRQGDSRCCALLRPVGLRGQGAGVSTSRRGPGVHARPHGL